MIATVQDARRERYEAEVYAELKAAAREIKRLKGLRAVAAKNGWQDMASRYDARLARLGAGV